MLSLEPVPDEAALWLGDGTLVVTDLHLGREVELQQRGFTMPSQAERMAAHLVELVGARRARRLVILGDLKHRVARSSGLERRDVPRFVARLSEVVEEIHVVKGNHDAGLEYYLPRSVKIHHGSGFALGDVGLAHGHTWPAREAMATRTLVMGHDHPTVMFVDALGVRSMQRCWVRLGFTGASIPRYPQLPEEVVVVPAFNEFSGGTTFNRTGTRLLGPLLNSELVDVPSARVYLLDGTYLGKLKDLMLPGRGRDLDA